VGLHVRVLLCTRSKRTPRDAGHIVNDRAGFANGQAFTVQSSEHIVSFRSEQLKENAMSGTKNQVMATFASPDEMFTMSTPRRARFVAVLRPRPRLPP
jgi:hypothetical protein